MRHYSVNYIYNAVFRNIYSTLNLRPSSYPYISGDSFRSTADHYFEGDAALDPKKVADSDIIFVESKNLKRFFTEVEPHIQASFVLISHNSDTNITEEYRPFLASKFLIHWFAQNCLIKDKKITPLPIGLENKWFHLHGLPNYFEKLRGSLTQKKTEMLYKFSAGTNPTERGAALEILKQQKLAYTYTDWREPFEYLKTLKQYKFVASPSGNGEDCHRTWEAMYLGTIPIVKRTHVTEYFYSCGLPLLLLDNWEDILLLTEENLEEKYEVLKQRFGSEALWLSYWNQKILSTATNLNR